MTLDPTTKIETLPKVSILISAYNHESYIEACLLSALQQSYNNIELIVIDDGSHDNTATVIKKLREKYEFIFIAKKNTGLSDTLNQALSIATGKYICQLGSDDIMLPDKTEKQVRFMETHPDVAVCGGNALLINGQGHIINERQRFPLQREISFDYIFSNRDPGIVASTAMVRKSVLDKEGGWNPDIPLEDMYLWLKLTSRGHRIVGLNDVLVYYRKHDNNTYKNLPHMYQAMMLTIAPYQDHPLYKKARFDLMRSYLITAAKKHNKLLALEIIRQIPLHQYNMKVLRGWFYLLCK